MYIFHSRRSPHHRSLTIISYSRLRFIATPICECLYPSPTPFASFFSLWFLQSWGTQSLKNTESWRSKQPQLERLFVSLFRFDLHWPRCMLSRTSSPRGSPASSLISLPRDPLNHRRLILILRFLRLFMIVFGLIHMLQGFECCLEIVCLVILWSGWGLVLWVFGYLGPREGD